MLATRLEAPWAPAILPGGEALVFERGGGLWQRSADGALRPVSGVSGPVVGAGRAPGCLGAAVDSGDPRCALSLAARRPDGTVATAVPSGG